MIAKQSPLKQAGRPVRRETLTAMLRAALESGETRFARQAALAWLAAFPGDLEVALLQAEAIMVEGISGDGPQGRVIQSIETVCRKDPLCVDAYRLLARASRGIDAGRYIFAVSSLHALGVQVQDEPIEDWAEPLRLAIIAYQKGQYNEAEQHVQETLRYSADLLLFAALHLQIDRATQDAVTVLHLAQIYNNRWPDCLVMRLALAEANLELGNEPEAVEQLHLCAAGDTSGQTARRLWGENHPYLSLWPEELAIPLDLPIPAGVAGRMGWNHLAAGTIQATEIALPSGLPEEESTAVKETEAPPLNQPDRIEPYDEDPAPLEPAESGSSLPWLETVDLIASAASSTEMPAASGESEVYISHSLPRAKRKRPKSDIHGTTPKVTSELERIAKRLKQPVLGRLDGRFPVYVIMTSVEGLTEQYGPQTTTVIQSELNKLAMILQHRPGWNAVVYYPDDADCTGQYGLTPVCPRDPWKLKNALCDLDIALRQRGQMIGALLIVGGEEIVPFHRLPNPTDDSDGEVFSDSPYATLDANYFVPEWPVGRLPGEKGPDAGLLLDQLHSMQRYHSRRKKADSAIDVNWFAWIGSLIEHLLPPVKTTSFGYTAAVWRRSSLAVFRPVGAPHTVKASPPEHSGSVDRERLAYSGLGYYNLHGLEDSPDWYGQRDPAESLESPDYPVALTPDDLRRNGRAPKVVFSEACFGANIVGKNEKNSLALKFLGMGTLAVVGSTCTAYGSITTPLIAADLLGHLFWQHLKSGRTAGEALMQAKLDLVREMNRRQGFLDGEDQKTLISFILYGDPLASYDGFRTHTKAYRMTTHLNVKTVPDQKEESIPVAHVNIEVFKEIKSIVAEYLPGAEMTEMRFLNQPVPNGAAAKGSHGKSTAQRNGGRMVVTVSKHVQAAEHTHTQIMRMTLDEDGKAVKLSLSR